MKKKHKKNLNIYSTWIIIFISIPIILYLLNFGENGFSIKSTNWSEFGSFIGGYGTLIFSAANLYFLIKVAYSINHLDDKRNEKNNELQNKRDMQNKVDSLKPLGIIIKELSIIEKYYIIRLNNYGSGPLLINNITINYKDKDYQSLRSLAEDIVYNLNITPIVKGHTTNKTVIGSNKSSELIKITFDEESNFLLESENIQSKFDLIIKELDSAILDFELTDLFGNKVELFE